MRGGPGMHNVFDYLPVLGKSLTFEVPLLAPPFKGDLGDHPQALAIGENGHVELEPML